jgi:hypothetical protein
VMESAFDEWGREIHQPSPRAVAQDFAIFCGVFGHRWVNNAIQSVDRQEGAPFRCVFAVNGLDREALSRLLEYQEVSRHEVWIVVNSANMGPLGSFYRNRDLLTSTWVAFLHQDDVYLADHVTVLRDMAEQCRPETVGLFTTLGGVSEDGTREMAPPPIRNAHLKDATAAVLVPEIIARHPFPTPAFALRSDTHIDGMAWYDSGAPDSEWFCRLACIGALEASDRVTVLYRQPTTSESTMTSGETRTWLWAQSLNRIMLSPEFRAFLASVKVGERDAVATRILHSIPARYPDSPIFRFIQFTAAQQMLTVWGYQQIACLNFVHTTLKQWGPSGATRSLEALQPLSQDVGVDPELSQLVGRPHKHQWWEQRGRQAYRNHAHRLPDGLRNYAVDLYRRFARSAT